MATTYQNLPLGRQKMVTKIIAALSDNDNNSGQYLSHEAVSVREMVNKFLTCDRMVLKPTRVLAYTIEGLAKELGITPLQVKNLMVVSQDAWRTSAPKLNSFLIELYCRTKFYAEDNQAQPEGKR